MANIMDRFIYRVDEWNNLQDAEYKKYCDRCIKNGVKPEKLERYFTKFDYKNGFVLDGKYPIYKKRKKDLY